MYNLSRVKVLGHSVCLEMASNANSVQQNCNKTGIHVKFAGQSTMDQLLFESPSPLKTNVNVFSALSRIFPPVVFSLQT